MAKQKNTEQKANGQVANQTSVNESKKGKPVAPGKQFTSEYQPSREAKSIGQKRRKFARDLQAEIERNVADMLADDGVDEDKIKAYIKDMPGNISFGRVVARLMHADILKTTSGDKRAKIILAYNKMAYGDKVDITSDDEKITLGVAVDEIKKFIADDTQK